MTTKLIVYNLALAYLGLKPLVSTTEVREERYLLDIQYDAGSVRYCLEQGLWPHAKRATQIEYTSDVEPSFGLRRAFTKPTDMVRVWVVAADEYFRIPLTGVSSDPGYWFADIDTIWVQYVSDDASYGGDLTGWPETFARMVAAYLASRAKPAQNKDDERRIAIADAAYEGFASDARSKAAQEGPMQFAPMGSWRRSRFSGNSGDRGSRSSLTG